MRLPAGAAPAAAETGARCPTASPGASPANAEPEPLAETSSGAGPQWMSGQPSLARLLEKLPYPVSYIDADLVYRQCNAAAAATVGRTPDQIVGRTVASVVGADSEVLALLRRVLESGEPYSGTLALHAGRIGADLALPRLLRPRHR